MPSLPRLRVAGLAGALVLLAVSAAAEAVLPPRLPADLPAPARARVEAVTGHPSLATHVEGEPFVARRDLFEFLLDHPEFATYVTRTLRLARYRIWREPDGLWLDDGWGTVGTFEVTYAAPGRRVMYARGEYHPTLLPSIRGQAVVMIDYDVRPGPDGKNVIAAAVSGFLKLDSRFLAFTTATLATPIARAKAEKEGTRLVRLFARTTHAVEDDPAGVYERLRRRGDVPAPDLEAFGRLLNLR